MPDPSNDLPLDWRSFEIEQSGASDGHCECCGSASKRVWGFIRRDGKPVATYFVGWTVRKPDHAARFDLILGAWGESAAKRDRYVVALDFRIVESSPQFMVVDGRERLSIYSKLANTALDRTEVVGTPLAPQVFALIDAIYMGDPRLDDLRRWSE